MATYRYRKVTKKTVDGVTTEEVIKLDGDDARAKMEEMSKSAEATDEAFERISESFGKIFRGSK